MTSTSVLSVLPAARAAAVSQTRNVSIDVAKGIGILLVVLGHNATFRTNLHAGYEAVYLFHMPLFFFLSGATFKRAGPLEALRKRARGLLVPYFAMGALAIALEGFGSGPGGMVAALTGILYGTGHTLRFTPLWFLPCLFLVAAAAALLLPRLERKTPNGEPDTGARRGLILAAAVSTAVGVGIISSGRFAAPPFTDVYHRPLGLPWSLDLVPFSLGLFLFGFLLARARPLWGSRHPWLIVTATSLLLALLVAYGASLDLNYRRMSPPWAAVLGSASGIALVIASSALISRIPALARVFAYLGSASLVLLLFHSPIQRRVLEFLTLHLDESLLVMTLGTGLTVAIICLVDIYILRRVPALGWICYPQRSRKT